MYKYHYRFLTESGLIFCTIGSSQNMSIEALKVNAVLFGDFIHYVKCYTLDEILEKYELVSEFTV